MTDRGIVRVITRLNVGGPSRQVLVLSKSLPARGFESHLVWGRADPREGQFEPTGLPNTHVPSLRRQIRPLDDARAYREVLALLGRHRPAVVHTHQAKAGAIGRLAARAARVPLTVHTFHGHVLDGYFPKPVVRALLGAERRLARITDVLIAVSPAVRDDLLARGIGRPEQWRVVPLGLDLDGLLGDRTEPAEARRRLGLPADATVVGIVARLVPIKDHQTFLEAAARVARVRPDVWFVVAGDGDLRLRLQERARQLVGDRCRFLGWVADLRTLYAALDVVVLTSRNEGTPVALIEAGAAARPVVSTRVGGVRDVVVDGGNGFLAPPGDAGSIASSILRLLEDPALAGSLGRSGRDRMAATYSAERLADDLAALYEQSLLVRSL